jgi:hypothetical protein
VKLRGEEPTWRIRAGDFRIVCKIHDRDLLVLVVRVAHRRDAYRGLHPLPREGGRTVDVNWRIGYG